LAIGRYPPSHVVNIDETSLNFVVTSDMATSTETAAAATTTAVITTAATATAATATAATTAVDLSTDVKSEGGGSTASTSSPPATSSSTTTTPEAASIRKKIATIKKKSKDDRATIGDRQRCTVLIGVTMSGEKLPPFLIFRGRAKGRIQREYKGKTEYPKTCKYAVQENAWMDKSVFLEWIELVWKPFCRDKVQSGTYILMDEFSVHMMTDCTDRLRECGTKIDFIMGGYNDKLQVLDVGNITDMFKDFVKEEFDEFQRSSSNGASSVAGEGSTVTSGGSGGGGPVSRDKKPTRCDIAKFVSDAWKKIPSDSIQSTWSAIGYHAQQSLVIDA